MFHLRTVDWRVISIPDIPLSVKERHECGKQPDGYAVLLTGEGWVKAKRRIGFEALLAFPLTTVEKKGLTVCPFCKRKLPTG